MQKVDPPTYIRSLKVAERVLLAQALGMSYGHLNNLAYERRQITPLYAARLERYSEGRAPRELAFPDEWREIWPELAECLRERVAANDETAMGQRAA